MPKRISRAKRNEINFQLTEKNQRKICVSPNDSSQQALTLAVLLVNFETDPHVLSSLHTMKASGDKQTKELTQTTKVTTKTTTSTTRDDCKKKPKQT